MPRLLVYNLRWAGEVFQLVLCVGTQRGLAFRKSAQAIDPV